MKWLVLLMMSFSLVCALTLQRISSKDVVVDSSNKLMWMDSIVNVKLRMTHKQAEPYCEDLNFAGYSNWRLPHIDELKLIVDKKNTKNYINRAFRYNQKSGYWADTAHFRTFWFYADYMNFISGTAYFDNRNVNKFVRCVRDVQ